MSSEVDARSDFDIGYYSNARPELVALVPPSAKTLLDVGCGTGAFGHAVLMRNSSLVVWGVEPVEEAAKHAAQVYSRVLVGAFPGACEGTNPPLFDCIAFNDVLEHMVDPWAALTYGAQMLSPSGTVLVSLPNVASLVVLKNVLRGRWDYGEWGVLDRTHLRFFSPATGAEMIEDAGLEVVSMTPSFTLPARRVTRAAFGLHPRFRSMLSGQTVYVARRRNV